MTTFQARPPVRELTTSPSRARLLIEPPSSWAALNLHELWHFRELLWTREDGGRWLQLDNMKVGESEIHGIIAALAESAPVSAPGTAGLGLFLIDYVL